MAISPIANNEAGSSVRSKINLAIAEANKVAGKADQSTVTELSSQVSQRALSTALAAETSERTAAVNNLQSQIAATADNLQGQIDQRALSTALEAEVQARSAGDDARALYSEVASEPTRPGEANRFFTSQIDGAPSAVPPIADAWKKTGPNGAVLAIPGAGTVAPMAVWRVEPGRQYRVRFVVQRVTDTEDPANDAIRLALRWLDKAKAGVATSICADLVDIFVSSGRLEYFYNFAVENADNIDFTSKGVYVRPFVKTFGSGVTHVEVIEIVDLSDAIEFAPDVSLFRRQLAGFHHRLEDFTTRLEIAEDHIEDSRDAGWFIRGTLDDDRLSTNVMLLAEVQTVTADKVFEAPLRMRESLLIGDGQVAHGEESSATARIIGDGDHFAIAPTNKAGGFNTLREWTYSHVFGVWLAEGGFRTTGDLTATQDAIVGRDALVERHAEIGGNLSVDGNAVVAGGLGVAGSATVGGDSDTIGNSTVGGTLGVTGKASFLDDLEVDGDVTFVGGTIDGVTIGGTTPAAATFTVVDFTDAETTRTNLEVYSTTEVDAAIAVETSAREAADTALSDALAAEVTNRENADAAIIDDAPADLNTLAKLASAIEDDADFGTTIRAYADQYGWVTPPATADATGTPGQKAYDADYLYVCVATDTWVRAALTTWS